MDFNKIKEAVVYLLNNNSINSETSFVDDIKNLLNENYYCEENKNSISKFKYFLGTNYFINQQYLLAQDFLLEALDEYLIYNNHSSELIKIYNNLTNLMAYLKKFDLAHYYADEGIKFCDDNNLKKSKGSIIISKASVYSANNDDSKAYQYSFSFLKDFIEDTYPSLKLIYFINTYVYSLKINQNDSFFPYISCYVKDLEDIEDYQSLEFLYRMLENHALKSNNYEKAYDFVLKKHKYEKKINNFKLRTNGDDNKFVLDFKYENIKAKFQKVIENNIKELKQSDFLSKLLDILPIPIFVLNPDNKYLFCNNQYLNIIKKTKEETIGKKYGVVHLPTTEELFENCQKAKVGKIEKFKLSLPIDDNNTKEFECFTTSFKYNNDEKTGTIAIGQDVTELFYAKEELIIANETKDKLFSIIGHDLRNFMGGTKELLDILASGEITDYNEVQEIISDASQASNNAYFLLQNLLNWSIAQRQNLSFKPSKYNIALLLRNTINNFEFIASKKNINFTLNAPDFFEITTDVDMLETILRNIINNSIKFTHIGGTISINVSKNKDKKEIIISDNGIGMKPGVVEFLNKKITNTPTYGTNGERGTGLGLALCFELISKMNGEIIIESKEGVGTKTKIIL